jgi:hypothetical protein
MPRTFNATTKSLTAIALVIAASVVLAACGGSSTSTAASKTAASKTTAASGSRSVSALRECLKKQGVTLPQRKPGKPGQQGAPGAGGLPFGGGESGGARQLPSGVSREKFEAAIKKCGGVAGRGAGGFRGLTSPTAQKSLAKFASCMRENGVDLPTPNTSGKGPVFNTKGINTKSAAFTAASKKCSSLLQFRRRGGGAPGGGGGAPGAGGAAPGSPPGA